MEIKIKNRHDNEIIVCGKYENIKECVEKNKYLQDADLRDTNLQGADLRGANLRDADLRDANLRGANSKDADFRGANLRDVNLRGANSPDADFRGANLRDANLRGANLRGADMQDAIFRGANLRGTDLRDVNFRGANLRDVDLRGANLRGANLRDAKYKEPLFICDLYSLKLLPKNTILTFWKYLIGGLSPYQDAKYEIGKEYKFKDYDSDENKQCGLGGNVATLMWCLKDNLDVDEFIEVEFKVKDIVAIPYISDGKFRVKKFKVLRKINRKEAVRLLKKPMSDSN